MSVCALNWAERQKIAGPASLKSTLKTLAWAADKHGACYPSQATIAEKSGLSERSVREAMAVLERLGMLRRQRRSRGAAGRTSDLVTLALHREFEISRQDIERLRKTPEKAASTGEICRLEMKSQPAKNVVATGEICRGYYRDTTVPIQEGGNPSVGSGYGSGLDDLDFPPWPEDQRYGVGRA